MTSFDDIERKRVLANISQADLCRAARFHPTSYVARKNGRRTISERSLLRLAKALGALINEREAKIAIASRKPIPGVGNWVNHAAQDAIEGRVPWVRKNVRRPERAASLS